MAYFIPAPTAFNTVPSYSSFPGVSGFRLEVASTTTLTLGPGFARAYANDAPLFYSPNLPGLPGNITIDITTVGAGGCYPRLIADASLTSKTVFGVYVIGNSSGLSGTLSTAAPVSAVLATGNNFLPTGYDSFRRVGLAYVDNATGLLIAWKQTGNANDREYWLQDGVLAVDAGSATSPTNVDLTEVDGVIMPGRPSMVKMQLMLATTGAGQEGFVQPVGLTSSTMTPVAIQAAAAGTSVAMAEIVCGVLGTAAVPGNAAIKYNTNNAAADFTIAVAGFTDSLGNDLF